MKKINALMCCLALLCLFRVCAVAEIGCDCGKTACICFIQMGDTGIAVRGIVSRLCEKGYLKSSRVDTFDDLVYDAVIRFQSDHHLGQSGMMDDDTLTMLLWEKNASQMGNDGEVWVPTDGGKKRHRLPTCSGMEDPRKVSVSNAQALGMDACKRCKLQ